MQQKIVLWFTAIAVAFGSLAGLAVRTAVAETLPAQINISAVQITGGPGKTSEDFIELFNPNPFSVDLNGYRLVKRTATASADTSIKVFNTETIIPPFSFYLWANAAYLDIAHLADTITSATLADNNSVGLRFGAQDSGQLIDSLSWGNTDNGFVSYNLSNPGAGESIVRENLFGNASYLSQPSSPRNSSMQFLPNNNEQAQDNAQCVLMAEHLATSSSLVVTGVKFVNIGSSTWFSGGYQLIQQLGDSSQVLSIGSQALMPGQEFLISLQLGLPTLEGNYLYTWQMARQGEEFGQACEMQITVNNTSEINEDPGSQSGGSSGSGSGSSSSDGSSSGSSSGNQDSSNANQGSGQNQNTQQQASSTATTIRITEFLPNPVGDDAGKEQIELFNYGNSTINLKDWVLDDITMWPASSNSYKLPELLISPNQYLAITIPSGKFALNNTGGDVLSLFRADGNLVSSVEYVGTAPEGKSYALVNGQWIWSAPSFGLSNPVPQSTNDGEQANNENQSSGDAESNQQENSGSQENQTTTTVIGNLVISEVYPAPAKGQQEFVELYNAGSSSVNLADYKLVVGTKSFNLPLVTLTPGAYYAITGNELKTPLADSGKEVKLIAPDGSLIYQVTYPKAKKGESYALLGEAYAWTKKPTPNAPNQASGAVTGSSNATLVLANQAGNTKVKSAANSLLQKASSMLSGSNTPNNSDTSTNTEEGGTTNPLNAIILAIASVFASAFAVYKFGIFG